MSKLNYEMAIWDASIDSSCTICQLYSKDKFCLVDEFEIEIQKVVLKYNKEGFEFSDNQVEEIRKEVKKLLTSLTFEVRTKLVH